MSASPVPGQDDRNFYRQFADEGLQLYSLHTPQRDREGIIKWRGSSVQPVFVEILPLSVQTSQLCSSSRWLLVQRSHLGRDIQVKLFGLSICLVGLWNVLKHLCGSWRAFRQYWLDADFLLELMDILIIGSGQFLLVHLSDFILLHSLHNFQPFLVLLLLFSLMPHFVQL